MSATAHRMDGVHARVIAGAAPDAQARLLIPTLEDAYLSILLLVIPHDNAEDFWPSIARADFLERVRRFSFLVTLLCSLYLGYAVGTGQMAMRLEGARGVYTSAWVGTTVALITGCFISLAGFYVIKKTRWSGIA